MASHKLRDQNMTSGLKGKTLLLLLINCYWFHAEIIKTAPTMWKSGFYQENKVLVNKLFLFSRLHNLAVSWLPSSRVLMKTQFHIFLIYLFIFYSERQTAEVNNTTVCIQFSPLLVCMCDSTVVRWFDGVRETLFKRDAEKRRHTWWLGMLFRQTDYSSMHLSQTQVSTSGSQSFRSWSLFSTGKWSAVFSPWHSMVQRFSPFNRHLYLCGWWKWIRMGY